MKRTDPLARIKVSRLLLGEGSTRTFFRGAKRDAGRRGVALIMVMVLIILISLGAYTFTDMMIAEERATVMAGRQLQAQAAVASGVEYVKAYLTLAPDDQIALGGHWDNPGYFRDVALNDADNEPLRFAVVSIEQDQYGEPTNWRYGLEDEGSKININTLTSSELFDPPEGTEDISADGEGEGDGPSQDGGDEGGNPDQGGPDGDQGGQQGGPDDAAGGGRGEDTLPQTLSDDPRLNVLLQLPLMTEQIADSILDWIDEDDTPRGAGAEGDMYSSTLSYSPSNAKIGSLDELLLVQGVTPELLYGADRNHNGLIEENEQSGMDSSGASGSMARGWSAYLTVHSKDYVPQSEDPAPIDINGDDLEALYQELLDAGIEQDLATYVIAFRQGGAYQAPDPEEVNQQDGNGENGGEPAPTPQSISGREPTFEGGDQKFTSVLDLIGTATQGKFAGAQQGQTEDVLVESPLAEGSDLAGILPTLMGQLSTGNESGEGRVNLNHCSSAVASGLPGMDSAAALSILSTQDPSNSSGDLNYLYPTWPLANGSVTVEQMKALLPYVSGQGTIFRAQIIGYSEAPGVYARAEVVFDASGDMPKVLSWRDLTHLGPGFDREAFLGTQ